MPYRIERIKIANTRYDRRSKLTKEQKEYIIGLRQKGKLSYQKIANMFDVSKTCIIYVCNPGKYQERKPKNKINKIDKVHRNRIAKEHRLYKQKLLLNGDIK